MKKLCKELVYGDKIETENGVIRKVLSVTRGMIFGQKMINFVDGQWSHAKANDEIELTA